MKITTHIDNFGRVGLPKPVRVILGLEKRMPLQIEVIGDKIQLSVPERTQSEIKVKGGRPVYAGKIEQDWDSGEAILRQRSERVKRE